MTLSLRTWLLASVLASAATLSACGSDDPVTPGADAGTNPTTDSGTTTCNVEPTFTSIHTKVLRDTRCTTCHGFAGAPAGGGTEFPADKAAAHAVVMGDTADASRMPPKRVVAGNADMSSFYLKLTSTPPFGVQMPSGFPALTACELESVRTWINNGAQNN